MKYTNKQSALLLGGISVSLLLTSQAVAQTGAAPADVATDLLLWLDANDIDGDGDPTNNPTDGDEITTWVDKSGNGHDAVALFNSPTYQTDSVNAINGNPVIRFSRNNGAGRNDLAEATPMESSANVQPQNAPQLTVFTVYTLKSLADWQAPWGIDNGSWDRFLYARTANDTGLVGGTTAGVALTEAANLGEPNLVTVEYDHGVPMGSAVSFNGELVELVEDNSSLTSSLPTLGIGSDGDGGTFDGNIAEQIVYDRSLDACERHSITAYLGDKYDQDYFDFTRDYLFTDYLTRIVAIGRQATACDTDLIVNSKASNQLRIDNPSDNTNVDEYFAFASDGGVFETVLTDVPAGTTERVGRAWRASRSAGFDGTVDASFDITTSSIADEPNVQYQLLIGGTGTDFSTADVSPIDGVFANGVVTFAGVNLLEGEYFTLGYADVVTGAGAGDDADADADDDGLSFPEPLTLFPPTTFPDSALSDSTVSEANGFEFPSELPSESQTLVLPPFEFAETESPAIESPTTDALANEIPASTAIPEAPVAPVTTSTNGDIDNDGIPDSVESAGDTDSDGVPDNTDTDSDNDGIPDFEEGTLDSDGEGIPNYLDLDSDNDGIPDIIEAGGFDSDGDGRLDNFVDGNGDGFDDGAAVLSLSKPDTDGDDIKDYLDIDSDNDSIPDTLESASILLDTNSDGRIDNLVDSNGDGLNDASVMSTIDVDGDSVPDHLDQDSDNDGIFDIIEVGGIDINADGFVDALLDADSDGIPDSVDADQQDGIDTDNDGIIDSADADILTEFDSDRDGIVDRFDPDPFGDGLARQTNGALLLTSLLDTDSDGIPDLQEAGALAANIEMVAVQPAVVAPASEANGVILSGLNGSGSVSFLGLILFGIPSLVRRMACKRFV